MTDLDRRTVLKWAGSAGMLAVTGSIAACATPGGTGAPGGPIPGPTGLVLPPGFSARVIARGDELVAGHQFRPYPDGAATFADPARPGGWYLTVNHEVSNAGGVTSIRFAPDGAVASATPILTGTSVNCAGGATPWGTWLSGEEFDNGQIWECDPTGATPAGSRPLMGKFQHEAAAVAADGRVYLTEDKPDGAFYRFTPTTPGVLTAGVLEVATGTSSVGSVTWVSVPDPLATMTVCRYQLPNPLRYNGGEGIATLGNDVWFTTKGDNRVWHYDRSNAQMSIRYQAGGGSVLSGLDNLLVDAPSRGLLVVEDGGDMQVVLLRPDNTVMAIAQVPHSNSEIAGPTFSPDGRRLYFSSQRGPNGAGRALGVLYEVTGDFDSLLGRP